MIRHIKSTESSQDILEELDARGAVIIDSLVPESVTSKIKDELVWSANALRTFILVGWIIYPVGYLVGTDMVDAGSDGKEIMAILYNIADMINKIGFGVVAWMGAKKASAMMS